jgi:transcription initiation factor TFIIB
MSNTDKYLDLSLNDIDKILGGISLDDKKVDKKHKLACKSCTGSKLYMDNSKGYFICEDCGVINDEILNDNPEFNNDINGKSRYGAPSNYFFPKSSLGTKIKSRGYNRISALQRQGQMPYREKSLLGVLGRIQTKCKKSGITQNIIDSAKILYKKVTDCKHTKGKRQGKQMIMRCINRRAMIAACVFFGAKIQGKTHSPKEIAEIFDLEIKHVNRGCRKFQDVIDIQTMQTHVMCSQSADFIERYSKKLNLDPKYIQIAKDITVNIYKLDLASTHEPPSVAAGSLLLITNLYRLPLTKKKISEEFGISDVTISKCFRKIFPYHKIITNNEVTDLIVKTTNSKPTENVDLTHTNLVISKDVIKKTNKKVEDSSDSESSEEDSIETVVDV